MTDDRGLWCLVTGQDFYNAIPQELARNGGRVTWSAPGSLAIGDLALLYEASPSSRFAWLFRACSDAIPAEPWPHMAWFEAIRFDVGVEFREAAADPIIGTWPKMRARLVGSNHAVPADAWNRLIELLVERNPDLLSVVEERHRTMSAPETRTLDDFEGADSYGFVPVFQLESACESALLEFLTVDGTFRLPTPEDGLALKGRQDWITPNLRTDLILIGPSEEGPGAPELVLIELKLWARSTANVAQLQGYLDAIAEIIPDDWPRRGVLVAQGFGPSVLDAADQAGIDCWLIEEDLDSPLGWGIASPWKDESS